MIYLDSSALVKLVLDEKESGKLREYLGRRQDRISSALALVELVRAVAGRHPAVLSAAVEVLEAVWLIDLGREVLNTAGRLGPATLRSLDAIHIASALALGDDLEEVVTYDKRMAKAARGAGLAVASPGLALEANRDG